MIITAKNENGQILEAAKGLPAIKPFSRKEYVLLLGFVFISFIVHWCFMVDGFGEADSARLAIAARMWNDSSMFFNSYTYRVSPLYLYILKITLQLGFPLSSIDSLMNWASLIVGSMSLVPMFYLYKKLINFEVAVMGCLLYSFTPAFWMANIYGMPLIHAFFWFLTSLLFFTYGLSQKGRWFCITMSLSALFACLSLNFKADIILCYGIYLGVVFYRKQLTLRDISLSLLILLVALISVLVISRMLFPSVDARLANPRDWNYAFPFTLRAITNSSNLHVIPKSVGKWLFLTILAAGTICLIKKKYRPQLLLVIFGSAPTFLFWGLKMQNSARHMMVAYLFLVFMLAFILFEITKKYVSVHSILVQ